MHERHRDIYKIGCNRKLRTFKVIFQQFKFSCSRGLASLCGAAASRRRAAWQWGWPRSLPQPRRRCVMHPAQWPQSPRRRRHRPRRQHRPRDHWPDCPHWRQRGWEWPSRRTGWGWRPLLWLFVNETLKYFCFNF